MGGGGGWDYDYSDAALEKSSKEYAAEAKSEGVVREYAGTESRGIPAPIGRKISTDSPTPLVVAVDVTGSMHHWPKVIFEKLPVLYSEAKLYLPNVEISFCAIGDANVDKYPLQVCDFHKGKDLEEGINAMFPDGGGGAGSRESYELAAYYYARHCDLRKAGRGLFVFCGDEGFYETIKSNTLTRLTGEAFDEDLDARQMFEELKARFDVFNLRVPYGNAAKDVDIHEQWQEVLGNQNVLRLDDPKRIVDSLIGLVAINAKQQGSFQKRLSLRQTQQQVDSVLATLHPLLGPASGHQP